MYLSESFLPLRVEKKKLPFGLIFLQAFKRSVRQSGMDIKFTTF